MADKTIVFQAPDGSLVAVKAVDTGVSDGRGNQIYRMGVDTTLSVGPITIGAVTLQDNDSLINADVDVVTSISETSDALAVQAPVLGKISDAADTAGGASTLNAKLRGLLNVFADIWNSAVHAIRVTSVDDTTQLLAPTDLASTDSFVDFGGSTIDSRYNSHLSYTLLNLDNTNGLSWQVLAANRTDFADSFIYQASANIAALGEGHLAIAPASYRYYKVQIKSQSTGNSATGRLTAIGKA